MRHLISLKDQSCEELLEILELAKNLKAKRAKGEKTDYLKNKTLLMLFQKSSTRTRVSFEAAMTELGGHSIFIDARTTQFSLADFKDEIRALMRFGHALMFRALRAEDVLTAASFNQMPIIDGCSEKYHPAQALGDILTMIEHIGGSAPPVRQSLGVGGSVVEGIKKIKKIVWLGIENNVSNTLKLACAKLGVPITICSPEADHVSIDEELNKQADTTGKVSYSTDPKEALSGADYVHTDTWMNMEFFDTAGSTLSGVELVSGGKVNPARGRGTLRALATSNGIKPEFEDEYERRKNVFGPYQLNAALINKYAPRAKIMHCMPCHADYEITRDAIDHKNSIIFDQAENRLHIEKGVLLWLLSQVNQKH